jgi:hypothetical protein
MAFVNIAGQIRYGCLLEHLQNDNLQNVDGHIKTLVAAYTLLTRWQDLSNINSSRGTQNNMTFITSNVRQPRDNQQNRNLHIKCYLCRQPGHHTNQRPGNVNNVTGTIQTSRILNPTIRSQTGNKMVVARSIDENFLSFTFVLTIRNLLEP